MICENINGKKTELKTNYEILKSILSILILKKYLEGESDQNFSLSIPLSKL